MLSIRMQRTGRKGHAMFRMVVQDSRYTPTSGKVVAQLGSFDPHTKTVRLDGEKASFYLQNGAQPSDRVALLLQKEGVKLPKWVKLSSAKSGTIRHPEKLRRNRPDEPAVEKSDAAPVEKSAEESETETTAESPSGATPAAESAEPAAEETATGDASVTTEAASDKVTVPDDAPETVTGTTES